MKAAAAALALLITGTVGHAAGEPPLPEVATEALAAIGKRTVLVNGTAVSGCLYLAAFIDGAEVQTVEALADGDTLSPVQEAFIEAGAFQCGYCTPGFLLMTTQLLDAHPDPDDDQIRHYLSGNLCRCAAYPEIVHAVKMAAEAV